MKTQQDNDTRYIINKTARVLIYGIYALLIIFGLISLMSPGWLRNISSVGKVSEAKTMQNYGDFYLNNQEYGMAAQQYQKAIRINPEMPEAYINLGVALKFMNDFENALLNFEKALEFKEVLHDATYYNMAEIYYAQNKPELAIQYYFKSAEVAPFPVGSLQKAGELLNNTAQWYRAKEAFDQALANAFTLKNCYLGMLKRDYYLFTEQKEKQTIKRLLETGVDNMDLSSYDDKAFNDALSRNFQMASIYNQYGYIYAMAKDYQKAAQYFSIALQIRPDFQQASSNLNAAYSMLRQQGE